MSFKVRYLLYMKILSNKKKKIKNFTIKILVIFLTLIHTDFFINSYLIILKSMKQGWRVIMVIVKNKVMDS